jgi:hypothetical protein
MKSIECRRDYLQSKLQDRLILVLCKGTCATVLRPETCHKSERKAVGDRGMERMLVLQYGKLPNYRPNVITVTTRVFRYTNHSSEHYPSSCLLLKIRCFGNLFLSPSSGGRYSAGSIDRANLYLLAPAWLPIANVVPRSLIRSTLKSEEMCSSESSILKRATRRNIPEYCIAHSHRHNILKSYVLHDFKPKQTESSWL